MHPADPAAKNRPNERRNRAFAPSARRNRRWMIPAGASFAEKRFLACVV
jgi:hypothetical protein